MKIDFGKERDSFLGYCMVNAVTHADKVSEVTGKSPDGNYDIQFIINGVELPLEETFEDIEKQMDEMVRKKALELIEEKLADISDTAYQITEELKKRAAERLNLEIEEC
jgi:hypothetical protein